MNYDVFDLFLARTSRRRLHFVRPFARPALPVELKNAARKSTPPEAIRRLVELGLKAKK